VHGTGEKKFPVIKPKDDMGRVKTKTVVGGGKSGRGVWGKNLAGFQKHLIMTKRGGVGPVRAKKQIMDKTAPTV